MPQNHTDRLAQRPPAADAVALDTVTIPANIFVACPAREFKQRAARKCEACAHFRGLADGAPGNPAQPFESRYSVICLHPITRRLARIETVDD